jgi:hypothetical protein
LKVTIVLACALTAAAKTWRFTADWRNRLQLERETTVRLAGLPEKNLTLWAGQGRRYVADIEMVSGGTAYTLVEMPDPILRWAGSGLDVSVGVRPVPGTPWVQLWAFGSVAETTFGKTVKFRTSNEVEPGGPQGVQAKGPEMRVDLPIQKAATWRHVVTIPAGRACLLNGVSDPDNPANVRVLIAEASVHQATTRKE